MKIIPEQEDRALLNSPPSRETVVRLDSLKELIESEIKAVREKMDERHERYNSRFDSQDDKTLAALSNSKEAVGKAEAATEKRFDSVNEFRETLRDQSSSLMPRPETQAMFKSYEEKLGAVQKNVERQMDDIRGQINNLQLARSESGGREKQGDREHDNKQFNATLVIAIIALFLSLGEIAVLAMKH